MRAKITYVVTAAVLVVYFVLVGSRGVLLIQTGTLLTVTFGVAVPDPAGDRRLVPLEEHPVRPQGQPARRRARGRRRPARRRAEAHPGRPHRPRLGRRGLRPAQGRDRGRPRTTGAAGSASPSPTTTPATPRAPARRCSARSPCTTASPSGPDRDAVTRPAGPTPQRADRPRAVRTVAAPASAARYSSAQASTASAARSKASGRDRKSALCVGQQRRRLAAARSRVRATSACPCTVRGSPSQRTGCCTVRTADDLLPRHRARSRRSPPAAARARSPTTPMRSSRSAHDDDEQPRRRRHTPAPGQRAGRTR